MKVISFVSTTAQSTATASTTSASKKNPYYTLFCYFYIIRHRKRIRQCSRITHKYPQQQQQNVLYLIVSCNSTSIHLRHAHAHTLTFALNWITSGLQQEQERRSHGRWRPNEMASLLLACFICIVQHVLIILFSFFSSQPTTHNSATPKAPAKERTLSPRAPPQEPLQLAEPPAARSRRSSVNAAPRGGRCRAAAAWTQLFEGGRCHEAACRQFGEARRRRKS